MSDVINQNRNIDIHDLMKVNSPHVWVMNTSDLNGRIKGGVINIPVTTERGTIVNVVVQNTFIPQDLSKKVPKKDLIDNPHFMRMVDRGLVTIVDEAWAKAEMKKPDSQMEYDRIVLAMNQTHGLVQDIDEADTALPDTSDEAGVNPTVIDVVNRDDLNDIERWSSIKKIEASLSDKDWSYIVKKSKADRLLQMANNHLKKR